MRFIMYRKLLRGPVAWVACLWLTAPLAMAEGAAAPNAQALAVADGAVSYCAPLDSAAAAKIRQLIKQLAQGASEKQLTELRSSDEYQNAYESVAEFTGKIDPHNAKQFCAEAAADHK